MDTKGHCFPKSIIIQAVYLKFRFTLSAKTGVIEPFIPVCADLAF